MRLGWRKWAALALGLLLVLLGADTLYAESRTCTLPVLMYHHFAQEGNGGTIVSEARFREQMEALKGDGFTAVTLGEVLDYVDNGVPLPEKPVLITMDDGYTSNLEIAAPILEELGFRATVFVIGVNEGRTAYLHDGKELKPPRFSYEEASEWVNKGVLDLQSHTWDMHQLAGYGFSGRDGVRALPGEKKEDLSVNLQVFFLPLYRDSTAARSMGSPFRKYSMNPAKPSTSSGSGDASADSVPAKIR